MKYLIINPITRVVDLVFDHPITPSGGMNVVQVSPSEYQGKMLGSIFTDVYRFKPRPPETWWVSDGTNWVDGRTDEEVWEDVRKLRLDELQGSDWTQIDDSPLTPPDKGLWTAYRNVLRNVPNNNPNDPRAAEAALKSAMQNKPATSRSA